MDEVRAFISVSKKGQQHVEAYEIADYLTELLETLKKACHVIDI